jgi:Uma2 family endonuclease
MSSVATPLLTTADLLAIPDDGRERWLIRGELREGTMTVRNRWHSRVLANIVFYLKYWIKQSGAPGVVYAGEAGVILSHDPATTVGVDVAYVSENISSRQFGKTTLIDGPPILAVEILSPSDTNQAVNEKVFAYLSAGVKLVWVADPDFQSIRVYEPGKPPVMFSGEQEISGEPHLSGFAVKVSAFFE